MDFSIDEAQRELAQLATKILSEQCTPERLTKLEKDGDRFSPDLAQTMANAGLFAAAIEEKYGGSGLGFEALCVVAEAMGRDICWLPIAQIGAGFALPLQRFGNEDAKQHWLPRIASAKALVTPAYVEPGSEDFLRPRLQAHMLASGLVLTGTKQFVIEAMHADAIVVSAMAADGPIVALTSASAGGVAVESQRLTTGVEVNYVTFKNTPVLEVLAEGEFATRWLKWAEQLTQVASCAMAVGLCDKMMRMTASYTSEREQFGRAVATFQGVAHHMADCYIDVECLRLVTQQAVELLHREAKADEAVLVAKIWCGDVCHRVSQAAQHCHGGIGVDRDYPLHRYCLMARQLELSFGSSAKLHGQLADRIAAQY